MADSDVGFFIDRGDGEATMRILDALRENGSEIESAYGAARAWEKEEGRRRRQVKVRLADGGLSDEARWPDLQSDTKHINL